MAKVLIIEDNAKHGETIAQLLAKKGIDSDIAPDGVSGLRSFARNAQDLVLVDFRPQMKVDDVCKNIRGTEKGRTVPILMISGFLKDPAEIERFRAELQLAGFLAKPFTSQQLYALVTSALSGPAPPPPAPAAPQQTAPRLPPAIKGDLAKSPFEKVLFYLMAKRGTGLLTVSGPSSVRRFVFTNGIPVELELPPGDEDFGHYLAGKNLIEAAELSAYEEWWRKDGEDPRDLFVKMGSLTPQRLQEENGNFLQDRLVDCFSWSAGSILFEWGASFITVAPAAASFTPALFYRGFRAQGPSGRINAYLEEKGGLYVGRAGTFYEYQNHLAAECGAAELFDLLDGLKTCRQILALSDRDDAAALLYTLDYLKLLSYSETPAKTDVAPPFPVRERAARVGEKEKEPEAFEDLGGELSELADEIGAFGEKMQAAAPAAEAPPAGLTPLEEDLKKQWETIKDKNYYELFGMTQKNFSFDKAKKAYFEFTRAYGPEKFFGSSSEVMSLAEEFLSRISNAYETLTNVVSKENYDELLSRQETVPTGEEDKAFYEQVQFQSGKVFLEQGQYQSAEKSFTNCVTIDSKKPEYYAYLALAVYNNPANKGNPAAAKRAKDMVNTSLKNGRISIAFALKGAMLLDEGSLTFAEAEFNKALKLNPNNKTALKGMDAIKQKREDEKKGIFQRLFR